ncbi:DNA translocase FtsK [Acinetobacter rudis]|uniref:DNA translocase FtsK n=1 Tax=Acinetobacter rudis TaxID=632955 RepID=A0AAW8J5R8_9GAMM|nr:DNA translocase FtsK 4TM domain-containing protein [Acinetobacter rudis]MDQ8934530.1 DNA translocase FtsK 4TM domain-containing protein [Acinetobacter rudis]MDQ8951708.1 DNA translocase FtsK 4TM domain-containing protein [Acinetobacter rudis]MDQ9016900.1 DNA translocase FtsK 4TM domain-containing protein [Acinetobacter rudis]
MTAVPSVYPQRFLVTIFLISFGIYLFLATVTYTPFDPGWMHISSDTQQVSNASGVVGAWLSDLLFGFLGWASLFIPIFIFLEAVQVWWPHSFLSRPFRYAAQFFIILTSASLLNLLWLVPADTLDNASGGIIGFEIGQGLEGLLTVYGAVIFLVVLWLVLFTLAFGIHWNRTWATLKAMPAYLQELFYKNVPESEAAYDRTEANSQLKDKHTKENAESAKVAAVAAGETAAETLDSATTQALKPQQDRAAQQLFDDMMHYEQQSSQATAITDIDDEQLEQTIAKAHALEKDTQRVVPTGEVWKALHQPNNHKTEIDALLRAAQDEGTDVTDKVVGAVAVTASAAAVAGHAATTGTSALDWDNDQIFDELLAAVPNAKMQHSDTAVMEQATEITAVEAGTIADSEINSTASLASELDELAMLADHQGDYSSQLKTEHVQAEPALEAQLPPKMSSYAQSTPFVRAEVQTHLQSSISDEEKQRVAADKDAFRNAWQESAGMPDEEQDVSIEIDEFDAPLTDSMGRPMSRAMQVAQKRLDLPPLPGLDLLDDVDPNKKVNFTAEQLARLSELLEIKLQEFNVKAKVIEAQPGPVVTRFELDLAPGVKASKVTNISRDLARSMSMASVRVVEVIPGKPYIGIEVPNSSREMVRLTELLQLPAYRDPQALISMAMGKDISGNPVLTDLAKAPHMLVAGTTGSGKSVAVNAMILSMLLKYTPDQLRLILIDPKQLELANYNDIPHLLTPVVTDMKDAVNALNWCVNEMERRYKLMSYLKIRKISDYNRKVEEALANGEDLIDPTWKPGDSATQERAPRLTSLPMIVIVADEFADMIMQVGKKAEEMITRLAQKSRAAGIHLLLATQRPSVDVITGLIKANIPTRVALRVNSKIDSRTILDAGGAEDLLGHGDMLFLGPGKIEPERVHGAFIADDEVNRICDAWRERGSPNYVDEILTPYDEEPTSRGFEEGEGASDRDALYDQCVAFVLETRRASTSSLQRKFSLGYNRAARIIDQMEENGIVSSMGANGKRDILV